MWTEFEEKSYEQYMNIELTFGHHLLPIGQKLEASCGFDAGLFTIHGQFWRYIQGEHKNLTRLYQIPYCTAEKIIDFIRGGEESIIFSTCESLIRTTKSRFKFNTFIQYKRPQYLTNAKAREWRYWYRPYYRYNIRRRQQQLLEQLSQKVKAFAVVVYAAPAFYTWKDLLENYRNGTLVKLSNFRKAEDLKGHRVFTYDQPGSSGRAFSEASSFEDDFSFEKAISRLRRQAWGAEHFRTNSEFINYIAQIYENVVLKMFPYNKRYQRIQRWISEILDFPWQILQAEFPGVAGIYKLNLLSSITNVRIFFGI